MSERELSLASWESDTGKKSSPCDECLLLLGEQRLDLAAHHHVFALRLELRSDWVYFSHVVDALVELRQLLEFAESRVLLCICPSTLQLSHFLAVRKLCTSLISFRLLLISRVFSGAPFRSASASKLFSLVNTCSNGLQTWHLSSLISLKVFESLDDCLTHVKQIGWKHLSRMAVILMGSPHPEHSESWPREHFLLSKLDCRWMNRSEIVLSVGKQLLTFDMVDDFFFVSKHCHDFS